MQGKSFIFKGWYLGKASEREREKQRQKDRETRERKERTERDLSVPAFVSAGFWVIGLDGPGLALIVICTPRGMSFFSVHHSAFYIQ